MLIDNEENDHQSNRSNKKSYKKRMIDTNIDQSGRKNFDLNSDLYDTCFSETANNINSPPTINKIDNKLKGLNNFH